MSPREIKIRKMAPVIAMASFIVAMYLMGTSTSPKAATLSMCLWSALFLLNGLLAVVRPIAWFHLMGDPLHKPLSRTANIVMRCFGVVGVLVGASMAFNIVVNFSGYWNGLY